MKSRPVDAELCRIALKAFWQIAALWRLTDEEQMNILGMSSLSVLRRCKSQEPGKDITEETLERISYVLGIYKAIHILLPIPDRANAWMRKPNKAPFLDGASAIDRISQSGIEGLKEVRMYLESELNR